MLWRLILLQYEADIIVLATGFKKPEVNFLEDDLFPEEYDVHVSLNCDRSQSMDEGL